MGTAGLTLPMSAAKALKAVPYTPFAPLLLSSLFLSSATAEWIFLFSSIFSLANIVGNDALRRFLPEMALPRFVECLSAVQWTVGSQSSRRTVGQAERRTIHRA